MNKSMTPPFHIMNPNGEKNGVKRLTPITKQDKNGEIVVGIYGFVDPKILKISQYQPRIQYDLTDLLESIANYGIRDEIQVNERPNGDLVIVDGVRRVKAAIELQLPEVPVIIKKLSDREEQEAVLINNLVRKSLTPIEIAHAIQLYKEKWDVTNVELGKMFFPELSQKDSSGKDHAEITSASQKVGRYIKLIDLPEEVQEMIHNGYSPEKGYFLTLLQFDKDETNLPDWQQRRKALQIELARSGIPINVLKKRVRSLIDDEKETRATVERERKKYEDILIRYNRELADAVRDFVNYVNIQFPIPDDYAGFNINQLKMVADHLTRNIQTEYTNDQEITRRNEIVNLLGKLILHFPYESMLRNELSVESIETVKKRLTDTIKTQQKVNAEINQKVREVNARWDRIASVHRKILRTLNRKN